MSAGSERMVTRWAVSEAEGRDSRGARVALGLDIGGSSIKSALLSIGDDGHPTELDTEIWHLDPSRRPEGVVNKLATIANHYRAAFGEPFSIGIGLPGLFDESAGSPTLLPNFPAEWTGYPFRSVVEACLGHTISLVNDAKAFSVAESVVGVAAGLKMVVCVVLGTGVGGGVVIDGHLWKGLGSAGELGHLTVQLDGPPCGCGNNGCVEAFASAASISAFGQRSSAQEVFEAAAMGDEIAQSAIDRAVSALGAGLANVFITLAPDAFVVGGGVAAAGNQLIGPLQEEIRRRVTVASSDDIRVLPAQLGRHAGAIGAALMGFQQTQ